jgi:hypothetical protein
VSPQPPAHGPEAATAGPSNDSPAARYAELAPVVKLAAGVAGAAIVLLALWARFHGLLGQTPFHDEWHALIAVATESPWQSAAKFGAADRSIPVVLWLHLLEATIGLTAVTLWLPFAVAGLLGVAGLPWLLRRELGIAGSLGLAALLAASPLLVFYSRFLRPYGICALGAVIAVVVLADFAERPTRARGLLLVLLASAVCWALPVFVPFLAGAMLFELARHMRAPRRHLPALVAVAAATACALVLLFAPALLADAHSLGQKGLAGHPTAAGLIMGIRLLLGGGAAAWSALLVTLAGLGAAQLELAAPRRFRCLGAACAAQIATVLVVRPAELERSFVFARYELPIGIVILAAAAAGVAWLARRSTLLAVVAAALIAGFVAPSAMDLATAGRDNFASMRLYQRFFFSRAELEAWFPALPPAYRSAFAGDPGGLGGVIEVPYNGLLRVPYPYYQQLHGREVFLGQAERLCIEEGNRELPTDGKSGIRLQRFIDLADRDALRKSGARFVVFHQDVESEVPWVRQETRRRNRFDFSRCVAAFGKSTGRVPMVADGLAVFDLAEL